jgi:hypothetical protein
MHGLPGDTGKRHLADKVEYDNPAARFHDPIRRVSPTTAGVGGNFRLRARNRPR